MNSLRARMALTLVISIVCVVGLSTFLISYVMGEIGKRKFADGVIDRVMMIAPILEVHDQRAQLNLAAAPGPGDILQEQTSLLKEAFRQAGIGYDIVMKQPTGGGRATVSVNLGPGWLTAPVPDRGPPRRVWYAVLIWMAVITVGIVAIALAVSHRITRQLSFLQSMATNVGANGVLERVPEEGPAEVRATAKALNKMGESLKSAIESRMRLVANAGHDLRTPMTRMRLRAEFLPEEERSHWLHDLDELDRIADSAIQLVREETAANSRESIVLNEFVEQVCEDLARLKLPVTFLQSESGHVTVAPLAFTRALRNLIINAATHGRSARVRVDRDGSRCVVIIEDDGPGIPENAIASVFEPFFRADPARRQHVPGAGLGLAIAKEIVERLGGKLVIENRKPNGLRQTILLSARNGGAMFACRHERSRPKQQLEV
ncbi:MAG: ATP-binding protein [Tardiphaga sp.]